MDNINNLDSTNKYVQGSVWKWANSLEKKAGVQSSERPVLIISNNTFNTFSPSVNCITITSVLKESPVHVPLFINTDSHIQCEQIHTVPKNELVEFKGMVPNSTLSQVKAKIRIQFDMATDRNTELFSSRKKSIDELNAKSEPKILGDIITYLELLSESAEKGFGIPEIEQQYLNLLTNLHDSFGKVRADIEELKIGIRQSGINVEKEPPASPVDEENNFSNADAATKTTANVKKGRRGKRSYTEEDKIFIADKNNSIELLMERYGYDKPTAHKMRAYFKKRLSDAPKNNVPVDNGTNTNDKKKKGVHRKYTDEDKKFIINDNNSLESLMERFEFKDKQAAYKARAYIKKTFI